MTTVSPAVGRITSLYGPRERPRKADGSLGTANHRGVDIAGPEGSPVVTPQDGTVTVVAKSKARGIYVVVSHGRYSTLHQHLDSATVKVGQGIPYGAQIGVMGTTGGVARHLHTEVHDRGTPIDPTPWYADRGVVLGSAAAAGGGSGPSAPTPAPLEELMRFVVTVQPNEAGGHDYYLIGPSGVRYIGNPAALGPLETLYGKPTPMNKGDVTNLINTLGRAR